MTEVAFDSNLDCDSEGEVDCSLDETIGKIPDDINESFSSSNGWPYNFRDKEKFEEGESIRYDPYEDHETADTSFFGGISRFSTTSNDALTTLTDGGEKIRRSLSSISSTVLSKAVDCFGERLSTYKPEETDYAERVTIREYVVDQEVFEDLTTKVIRTTRVEEKTIRKEFNIKMWEYWWTWFVGEKLEVELEPKSRQILNYIQSQEKLKRQKTTPDYLFDSPEKKRRISIFSTSASTPGSARKKLFHANTCSQVESEIKLKGSDYDSNDAISP
mmetsp:Transcript_35720/g.40596  ORF Transcript_35720/g.40596 Transcript_35720/m.40596 type:complete len:274 (+) Transcript_35720:254-1075(+)